MTWTRLAEIASVRSFVLALVFGLLQAWPQITAWRMANWKAKSFCIFLVLGIFFAGLQYVTSGTFLGQAKEHQPQVPLLKGQIDGSYIGRFSQGTPSTAITLVVSIRNRGAPSIVEDWSLSVIPPGGTPLSATHYFIPETLTLEREHGSPVIWHGHEALYNKTIRTPLSTGGMERGILVFLLERVDRDTIYRAGTKLVLRYKDVAGTLYSIEQQLAGQTSEPAYWPGLTPPAGPTFPR